jgi:hypothetical protein
MDALGVKGGKKESERLRPVDGYAAAVLGATVLLPQSGCDVTGYLV